MTDKRNIWEDEGAEEFLAGFGVGVALMLIVGLVIFAWMVW